MQCPVCNNHETSTIHLHTGQFSEDLLKCASCGSIWSINHGVIEMVRDTQEHSFLSAVSECVEADDYCLAA